MAMSRNYGRDEAPRHKPLPARSARSESRDKTEAPDPRAGAAVWRLSAGHILSTCGTGDITDRTVPALSASEAAALLGSDACASPLHEAAFQGRVDEVRRLLEAGADPHARSFTGETPLHLAALAGRADVVRLLLDKGADPRADSSRGTPLHRAAEGGAAEVLELLLNADASVQAPATGDETPLHTAARMGQAEAARLLLEHGADPNVRDSCRNTPLHAAAAYKDSELAEMLLAAGADVNARNEEGDTPLSLAERAGAADTAALLRARGAKATSAAPRRTPNEAEDKGENEAEGGCGFARGESDAATEAEEPEEDVGEVLEAYLGARKLYGTDSYARLKQAVAVRVCWQWSREDIGTPLPSACVCLEGSEARFFIDSLLRHAVYHPESHGRIIPVDEADDYYCDDACTDQFPTLIFYDAAGRPVCWLDWIDFYPPLEGKYPNLFALPPSVFSALDALIIRRLPAAARPSEGRAKS